MSLISLTVAAEHKGLRADKFLANAYPQISRTRLQKFFDEEKVLLDGEPIEKSFVLEEGQTIEFPHPDTLFKPLEAREVPFDVLFEDKYFFAINKPVGIAVHPVSIDDDQTTIAHGVLAYLGEKARKIGPGDRPCIVHRLDKETSGVLLIAKTEKAFNALKEQFANREIDKRYLAIVRGCPDLLAGSITAPIARSPRNPLRMTIANEASSAGKPSRTDWERVAIDEKANIALLSCQLHTGRTHQARVHLAHLGYPVLGDTSYGYQGAYTGRPLLHSYITSLNHPITGKPLTILAPLPKDFLQFKSLFPSEINKKLGNG